jgi:bifunctional non-homologous end joining protein LigD
VRTGEAAAGQLSFEHDAFPSALRPMQAVSAEAPFSSNEYIFEVKWDGIRCLCFVFPDGRVQLQDRALRDMTAELPEVARAAADLPPGTILDGELVSVDNEGRPDLEAMRHKVAGLPGGDSVPYSLLTFDLLWLAGKPQLRQPLVKRRSRLKRTVRTVGPIFVPDWIERDGTELFEACLERGMEGVMAKHVESTYVPGQRSPFWLKVKAVKSDDFVVIGFQEEEGRPFGALLIGFYESGRLLPCGTVTGGFDGAIADRIATDLRRLEIERSPLVPPPVMTAPVRWVRPELVVSVRYSEWSPDGTLRFPIFNDLRPDIHPAECVRRRPRVVLEGRTPPGSPAYDLTVFPF